MKSLQNGWDVVCATRVTHACSWKFIFIVYSVFSLFVRFNIWNGHGIEVC